MVASSANFTMSQNLSHPNGPITVSIVDILGQNDYKTTVL